MDFNIGPVSNDIVFKNVDRTTFTLFTTSHLLEAKANKETFKAFDKNDLNDFVIWVLQRQGFMVYQWLLLKFMLSNPLKIKSISSKFFAVTPNNFKPTDEEITEYLHEPKLMWRYSITNYNSVCALFANNAGDKLEFIICERDFSGLVEFSNSKTTHVSKSFKKMFHRGKTLKHHKYNTSKIFQLMKKFKFSLNDYECLEYLHADEFHLYLMNGNADYKDFVSVLLTGQYHSTGENQCQLRERYIVYRNMLNEIGKTSHPHDNSCFEIFKNKLTSTEREKYEGAVTFFGVQFKSTIVDEIKEIVERRNNEVSITNPLYVTTNWVHENNISKSSNYHSWTFYEFAFRIFGWNISVNNFVKITNDGKITRLAWKLPCDQELRMFIVKSYKRLFYDHYLYDNYMFRILDADSTVDCFNDEDTVLNVILLLGNLVQETKSNKNSAFAEIDVNGELVLATNAIINSDNNSPVSSNNESPIFDNGNSVSPFSDTPFLNDSDKVIPNNDTNGPNDNVADSDVNVDNFVTCSNIDSIAIIGQANGNRTAISQKFVNNSNAIVSAFSPILEVNINESDDNAENDDYDSVADIISYYSSDHSPTSPLNLNAGNAELGTNTAQVVDNFNNHTANTYAIIECQSTATVPTDDNSNSNSKAKANTSVIPTNVNSAFASILEQILNGFYPESTFYSAIDYLYHALWITDEKQIKYDINKISQLFPNPSSLYRSNGKLMEIGFIKNITFEDEAMKTEFIEDFDGNFFIENNEPGIFELYMLVCKFGSYGNYSIAHVSPKHWVLVNQLSRISKDYMDTYCNLRIGLEAEELFQWDSIDYQNSKLDREYSGFLVSPKIIKPPACCLPTEIGKMSDYLTNFVLKHINRAPEAKHIWKMFTDIANFSIDHFGFMKTVVDFFFVLEIEIFFNYIANKKTNSFTGVYTYSDEVRERINKIFKVQSPELSIDFADCWLNDTP